MSMINTCEATCKKIDDLSEVEEPIKETFRPDFTVYIQGQQSVSVQGNIADKSIQKESLETQGQPAAQHMPFDTMPIPQPIPAQLTDPALDMPKETQTTEAATKLCK